MLFMLQFTSMIPRRMPTQLTRPLALLLAAPLLLGATPKPPPLEEFNERLMRSMSQGDYQQATEVARQAVQAAEQAYGPNHLIVSDVVSNLAGVYSAREQDAQAEPLYRRVLAIREQQLPVSDIRLPQTLTHLAEICSRQGRYAEAETFSRRLLEIYRQAQARVTAA